MKRHGHIIKGKEVDYLCFGNPRYISTIDTIRFQGRLGKERINVIMKKSFLEDIIQRHDYMIMKKRTLYHVIGIERKK